MLAQAASTPSRRTRRLRMAAAPINGFEVMRMIRKGQWLVLKPGAGGAASLCADAQARSFPHDRIQRPA
jgi:hypothetical protein